jgi:hypothetical protein
LDLGEEIHPGAFYKRIITGSDLRVDRFIVRPGVTVPFHTNAEGNPYKVISCGRSKFLSLDREGRVLRHHLMEPGEEFDRPEVGFGHMFINLGDDDCVLLKLWPWPPQNSTAASGAATPAPKRKAPAKKAAAKKAAAKRAAASGGSLVD